MNNETLIDLIEKGIDHVQAGQTPLAVTCFAKAVQIDPRSARAWYWLWKVIDDPEKKKYCYSRVSALDPNIFQKEVASTEPKPVETPSPFVSDQSSSEYFYRPAAFDQKITTAVAYRANFNGTKTTKPQFQDGNTINHVSKQRDSNPEPKNTTLRRFLLGLFTGLVLLGVPLVYLVVSGLLDPFERFLSPILYTLQPNDSTPTLQILAPTQTPTPTPTPTLTVEYLLPSTNEINDAYQAALWGDYPDAIFAYNEIIENSPDNAEAYFRRGDAYDKMVDGLRSQGEYLDYIQQAIDDYDHAISIDPSQGDYYVWRGLAIWDLGAAQNLRSENEGLYDAALENMQIGMELGTIEDLTPSYIASLNRLSGNCEQSVALFEQLVANKTDPSDTSLDLSLAWAYLCVGEYQKVLDALSQREDCNCDALLRACALYGLRQTDEMLGVLNTSILEDSDFGGERYFMRALNSYDHGWYEQARNDLELGEANTWDRGPIYSYVMARLAAADGDLETAQYMMQYAEASLLMVEGPMIINMIQQGLLDLDVEPLQLSSQTLISITPIPSSVLEPVAPDVSLTPTPDVEILPGGYEDAIEVSFSRGTGSIAIPPSTTILYHFLPDEPLKIVETRNLEFQQSGREDFQKNDLQITLFRHEGGWRWIYPDNRSYFIPEPDNYIYNNSEMYIAITNKDEIDTVYLNNIGIVATVLLTDGSTHSYGFNPSIQN